MNDSMYMGDIEIWDRCAEALYLTETEKMFSGLPVKPWKDAAPDVVRHCLRRAKAVLDCYEALKSGQQAES